MEDIHDRWSKKVMEIKEECMQKPRKKSMNKAVRQWTTKLKTLKKEIKAEEKPEKRIMSQ